MRQPVLGTQMRQVFEMSAESDAYVHDHPVRGRLNAGFFTLAGGYIERLLRGQKQEVFDGLGQRVVEIGPGVGANLRYYRPGTELLAVEPNRRMHPHLRRNAARAGVQLTLLETGAETVDLADGSVDDAVCTLVLCTVTDPQRAVAEIARMLRPGGRFRFVEHVAAPPGTFTRSMQRLVRRPWRWAFEGCRVDQPTDEIVAAAPFREVSTTPFFLRSPFLPTNTGIAGIAVR